MHVELQPTLENDIVKLVPLTEEDFEILYQVASDPLIWEQHPDRYRYKRDVFEKFFKSAMESHGAFLILDQNSDEVIGGSRYYDFDEEKKSIAIGYTFLARKCWGTIYNKAMKTLMLDHAFKFVDTVIFHIGAKNIRSQRAIEKLGAKKIGEEKGNSSDDNNLVSFIYTMNKKVWNSLKNNTA